MKLNSSLILICSALAAMLVATQSPAAKPQPPANYDSKSYRATACQARPPEAATFELGGICNPSSSSTDLEVVCPIVRDNVNNEDGVLITINFGVGVSPVVCTAYSWESWSVIDEVTNSTSGGGFVSTYLQLDESVPGGSYSFSCILPAGDMSCILSYEVFEWEGSNDNMTDYNR